jgi:ArsR family transcriptional regulator, lead/cadmium/zinc/bismuth-responsive transcriptional repressor
MLNYRFVDQLMPSEEISRPELNDGQTETLADMLHLMGEPNRLRILMLCLDKECAVGDIATGLQMTPSLTSHHLRLLKAARLVRGRRQGKQVFYGAADDHVRHVLRDLIAHIQEERS